MRACVIASRFKGSGKKIKTGNLTQIGSVTGNFTGAGSSTLVMSPDGKHVYGWKANAVQFLAKDPVTGILSPCSPAAAGSYQGGISGGYYDWGRAIFSPDGLFLYTMSLWGGIFIWSRNASTGVLTPIGQVATASAPTGTAGQICDMCMPKDGSQIYYTTPGTLRVLARNPSTGALSLTQTVAGSWGSQAGMCLTGDDDNLYWTSPNGQYSTKVYQYWRYPPDGTLQYIGLLSLPAAKLRMVSNSTGTMVYALNSGASGIISRFSRQLGIGTIANLTYIDGISMPGNQSMYNDLMISPDGVTMYACNNANLVQFAIAADGSLSQTASTAFTSILAGSMNNDFAYFAGNPLIEFSRS